MGTMTKKTAQQAIIVLGMHRSGTSALAGALGMLGIRLPTRLLPTTPDNPKGYFEPDQIVAIHERLLAAAGTKWSSIEKLPEEWVSSAEASAYVHELASAVRQDYDDASIFVIKDPRMCRLIPIWRKVLVEVGVRASFAIPLRNPIEVARSLEKRDGLPLAHGCLMWLRHVLDAEFETRGSRRVFIHYHDLLSDPAGVAEHVASQLTEKTPRLNAESKRDINSFIDAELRHHIAEPAELQHPYTFYPWLKEAYEAHSTIVDHPDDKTVPRRLDRLRAVVDSAVKSFSPLLSASQSAMAKGDAALAEREGRISALNQRMVERDVALADRERKIIVLDKTIVRRDAAVLKLEKWIAALTQIQSAQEDTVATQNEQITSLNRTAAYYQREVATLTAQRDEIFSSTIWRLLAPLRWYGRQRQRVARLLRKSSAILLRRVDLKITKPNSPPVSQANDNLTDQATMVCGKSGHNYRCSLVIPTKNGGPLFKQLVERLQTQTCWPEVEFIVIDSGSTDETISIARSAGAMVHSIPANEFNHGSTRDFGISRASSNYVILMVQDALPNNNLLIERLLSALAEEGVAGAYARQLPQPTADVITKRNLNAWLTAGRERKVKAIKCLDWYESLPPMEKYLFCNFDNVCSAIDRRVWKEEPFGSVNFGEDIDWAERVLKRKLKIVYEPGAVVVHSHDRSLIYEYKRTYMCHRFLYRRFGLHLVPSLRGVWWVWLRSSTSDILFIARKEKLTPPKILAILMAPATNLVAAIAQHRAVRDEIRGIEEKVQGV